MRGLKGIRRILSVSLSVLLLFSAAAVSLSVAAEEEPVILYAGDAVPAEHTAITSLTDALADSVPMPARRLWCMFMAICTPPSRA